MICGFFHVVWSRQQGTSGVQVVHKEEGTMTPTERVIRMTEETYQRVATQANASSVSLRVALERIVALGVPAFEEKERPYRGTASQAVDR